MSLQSRRVGVSTRALHMVRTGHEAEGRQGTRCAVKGCTSAPTMFCSRQIGHGTQARGVHEGRPLVAVIGYCDLHERLSARFNRQTEKPWQ